MTSKEISQKDEGKKEEEKKKTAQRTEAKVASDGLSITALKKGLFCAFYSLRPAEGHHRVETPTLPSVNAILLLAVLRTLKPQGLTAKPAYAPLPFFLLFFFLFLSYSGSNREGVKKTSLPRYYALLEEEEARFLPRNYLSIHLTRPETLVPRKGVISPLEPDLDSSPLVSVLSFMARLPVTGFRPGLCVMPCFRQFEVCLRNTRTSSTCS